MERKYGEREVREIFGIATRQKLNPPSSTGTDGLTLGDIQSIGLEVGLDPDRVARAAASLDARVAKQGRRSWGMPIEVGRVVALPRAPTDREWELLVAELRSVFRARGRVTVQGGFREWSNGNLHACIEPVEGGYRLRLGTLKGDAAGVNALGALGLIGGAILAGTLAISGGLQDALFAVTTLGVGGAGAFITNAVRLPRWSRERDRQMAHIEARIRSIMESDSQKE